MLFNSFEYVVFLPIVVLIYYLLPNRFKLFFLFLASCIFYMSAELSYLTIILFIILVDYVFSFLILKSSGVSKLICLILGIFLNLFTLLLFKYFDFFSINYSLFVNLLGFDHSPTILSIVLPIGISFYTLQGISYLVEVFRGKYIPDKNILRVGLYILFFPQLIAGPIERPKQLLSKLTESISFRYENIVWGLRLILWGMFKKVAVADSIAVIINPVFESPESFHNLSLLLAVFLFAFQIYYDFSGYTDIARGSARLLGYRLEINFNNPYLARSVQDFWRRWHITLSLWFRDYVYIPLGGNRGTKIRVVCTVLVTFILAGLWHGASWNFVVWGLLNGIFLSFFHLFKRRIRVNTIISITGTFLLICITWIFFRTNTLTQAWYFLKQIILLPNTIIHSAFIESVFLKQNMFEVLIVVLLIFIVEIIQVNKEKFSRFFLLKPISVRWFVYIVLIWIIVLSGNFGEKTFIYFAF